MSVWVPNRIVLKARGRYDEGVLDADAYPGMFMLQKSNGNYIPHNVIGGGGQLCVATEDALRAGTVISKLTSADAFPFYRPARGDEFLMLLQNGQNVLNQAPLMSAGDGTLVAGPTARLFQIVAPSATIANTTVETAFSNGSYSIPANTLAVGDVIRIRAKAFQISVNATPTERLKTYLNTTVVGDSGAISVIAADVLIQNIYITVRTIGATGTFIVTTFLSSSASGVFTDSEMTVASTTVDTTAAVVLTAKGTASAAHANNQTRLDEFEVDLDKSAGLNVIAYAAETRDNSGGTGTSVNSAMLIRAMIP